MKFSLAALQIASLIGASVASPLPGVVSLPLEHKELDLGKVENLDEVAEAFTRKYTNIVKRASDKYTFPTNDYTYIGTTVDGSLGTPGQSFKLALDLSTGYVWVPGQGCTSGGCSSSKKFSGSSSSTYKSIGGDASVTSGSGKVSGKLAQDVLSIGGASVSGQSFIEATSVELVKGANFEGGLGLGRNSTEWPSSPVINLFNQGAIKSNMFAIDIPEGPGKKGEITFGGFEFEKAAAPYNWIPVGAEGSWNLPVTTVYVGGAPYGFRGTAAFFDTNSPFIFLPTYFYQTLSQKYSEDYEVDITTYISCDFIEEAPEVLIYLYYERFELKPSEYITKLDDGRCIVIFRSLTDHTLDEHVVLGTPFMRKYYTVYDGESETMAIITKK